MGLLVAQEDVTQYRSLLQVHIQGEGQGVCVRVEGEGEGEGGRVVQLLLTTIGVGQHRLVCPVIFGKACCLVPRKSS